MWSPELNQTPRLTALDESSADRQKVSSESLVDLRAVQEDRRQLPPVTHAALQGKVGICRSPRSYRQRFRVWRPGPRAT